MNIVRTDAWRGALLIVAHRSVRRALIAGALAAVVWSPVVARAAEMVELSAHFALKVVPAAAGGGYQEVYTRDRPDDRFRPIGTTPPAHWDRPFSGPALESMQASVTAVSSDGRTLLYWHRQRSRWSGPTKAEGVYRHRVGEGEALLLPASQLVDFWHRYDRPLPRQVMAIRGPACTTEPLCALSADDGSITPLALWGSTPLHRAAYANDLDGVRAALNQPGSVDAETWWGYTPLAIAVKKGHDDVALMLLEHGADVTRKVEERLSPLKLAVHLRRWRLLQGLRPRLGDPALLVHALPTRYAQFMADRTEAARPDDLPRMVRLLLEAGLDASAVQEPVVLRLLEQRDRLREGPALIDTLKLLLAHGARADQAEDGSLQTPLHHMATASRWRLDDGARDVLDLLRTRLATLEARDRFGLTALQAAMLQPEAGDTFEKVRYLRAAGADDGVEYLCGVMRTPTGLSVRQKLAEWGGVLPARYDCGAYRK